MTEVSKRRRKRYLIAILIVVIIIAAGVGAYLAYGPQSSPQKVDFIMDFVANGSKAPYYVALDRGFWAQQGLDVNVIPNPTGSAAAVRAVAGGKADFGVADLLTAMTLFTKENITNVRAIAVYYAYNPSIIVALKKSGIVQPKDLEGKTLGNFVGASTDVILPIFAQSSGIDLSKVKRVYVSPALVAAGLVNGKFDAICLVSYQLADVYATVPPTHVVYFAYKDYGVKALGHVFLTRTDIIQNKPDLVKKFLTGLREGIQYAVKDPRYAATAVLKYNAQLNYNVTLGEWNYTVPYIGDKAQILNDLQSIGWIDPNAVQPSMSTFQQIYGVSETATSVFDTRFVTAPTSK